MERIKRLRKAKGLSLTEMARRTGLHREAVARIEHRDTDPRASTLVVIARALGVPVCELFGKEAGHHERGSGTQRSRRR